MKALKHFVAAVVVISLFTSCSLLSGLSSSNNTNTSTTSTGWDTGSALATIFGVLQNKGTLDLGNLTTLINLGKILIGANSLVDADQAYTDQFAKDLIKGSNKTINKSNVNNVIAGLKSLAATDTSVLNQATTEAFAGHLVPVSRSDKSVNANMNAIESILKNMK